MSVMSSSAPTSPTSSDGDDLLPTLPAVSSQHRDRRRRRPIPQFSYSKTRARPGLIAQCGPFFGFNTRKTIHRSSYHSDVSQSAPSSPTADTYETLPLVEHAVQLDGICSGETPEVHVLRNSTAKRDLPTDLRKLCSTMNIPNNFPAATKPSLLQVLQRLGIQSVWPRLVEHGIIDVRRLGQITRTELIQMGITDAEVRSALLTAGQLLAVQDIDVPVSSSATAQCTWTRTIPPEGATDRLMDYVHMADEQAMHDSGCCSINEVSGSWCNKPPECTVNSSAVQLRSPIYSTQTWSNRGPPQSQIEARLLCIWVYQNESML
ncbi:unnamed protein product [Dicrocoelium dendriticum]|nr:unnamed protein product [Dicrocoelium dendriticum]